MSPHGRMCPAWMRSKNPNAEIHEPKIHDGLVYRDFTLLGNRLESLFSSVGITKERVAEAKAALGLPPSCNCPARQEWINKAHLWLREKLTPRNRNR
jgi:hypothetical protein